tara:strand:+ start:617 stop:847 length:231 start_codon:yes stop_codon:yes gene_type:complete
MNIDIKYGNTIYSDDKIAKYTEFKFDTIKELKDFWINKPSKGQWEANINQLTVTHSDWITSKEYFEMIGDENECRV